MLAGRSFRGSLDLPVSQDNLGSERGERSVTAMGTSMPRRHRRRLEHRVEAVYQEPGPSIGHAELLTGRGDGTLRPNRFEQADLAGTESPSIPHIDPQGKSGPVLAALR